MNWYPHTCYLVWSTDQIEIMNLSENETLTISHLQKMTTNAYSTRCVRDLGHENSLTKTKQKQQFQPQIYSLHVSGLFRGTAVTTIAQVSFSPLICMPLWRRNNKMVALRLNKFLSLCLPLGRSTNPTNQPVTTHSSRLIVKTKAIDLPVSALFG